MCLLRWSAIGEVWEVPVWRVVPVCLAGQVVRLCMVRKRQFENRSSVAMYDSVADMQQRSGVDGDPLDIAQIFSSSGFPGGGFGDEPRLNLCVSEVGEGGIPRLGVGLGPTCVWNGLGVSSVLSSGKMSVDLVPSTVYW